MSDATNTTDVNTVKVNTTTKQKPVTVADLVSANPFPPATPTTSDVIALTHLTSALIVRNGSTMKPVDRVAEANKYLTEIKKIAEQ